MRRVEWTDRNGYRHASLVRDEDPDSLAEAGVPQDPPDLERLDWEGLRRDIHNALAEAGILNWEDLQRTNANLQAIACRALKRHLVQLYRTDDQEVRHAGNIHSPADG